jgi:hypothetical protein
MGPEIIIALKNEYPDVVITQKAFFSTLHIWVSWELTPSPFGA